MGIGAPSTTNGTEVSTVTSQWLGSDRGRWRLSAHDVAHTDKAHHQGNHEKPADNYRAHQRTGNPHSSYQ
jgi:hypothetical protein